jgi:hypothetical protein
MASRFFSTTYHHKMSIMYLYIALCTKRRADSIFKWIKIFWTKLTLSVPEELNQCPIKFGLVYIYSFKTAKKQNNQSRIVAKNIERMIIKKWSFDSDLKLSWSRFISRKWPMKYSPNSALLQYSERSFKCPKQWDMCNKAFGTSHAFILTWIRYMYHQIPYYIPYKDAV